MSKQRLEWKVGLFVLVGLVLTALMVMRFSKGTSIFQSSYQVNIEGKNAGGIIHGASVLMAGVPVGRISAIKLKPDGSRVTMVADIQSDFRIARNAVFTIDTVGFLGDRVISVRPNISGEGNDAYLEDGATVEVKEPYDLTQVAQSAGELMGRFSGTLGQLSNAVERLDRTLLSQNALSDLTNTVANFRGISERALGVVDNINTFVVTNTPSLNTTISNFSLFTDQLNLVTLQLQETLATNRLEITAAIKNLGNASDRVTQLLDGVEEGKGLAGALLKDEELSRNVSIMTSNFMVLSSNMNRKGLWGVIRKPKK